MTDRYQVRETTGVEVYEIGNEAVITLNPSTGYVSVSCSWHDELNGCHYWNARGGRALHEFLCEISRDYALGKLFGHDRLERFDLEKSVASLKSEIIRMRRDKDLKEDEARDLWHEAELCESPDDIARMADPHGNTFYECIQNTEKTCASWFWDNVWSAFIQHLKSKQ